MMMKKSSLCRNGRSVIMIMVKMDARIVAVIVYVSARMESTDVKSAIGHQNLMTTCRSSGRDKSYHVFFS
ncbi:hypothetical protein A7S80_25325 [Salmonella enterica subsp. enterica serovar Mbandaka]|nr:hypothetical protein A7S73_25205 [Salmonella enterica subsp. enterica serovar Mbandaka]OHK64181.1 hypothetical protein A7S80_25325 [Salmonella enterica subsp. enterica serovar Mbandaka]